MRNIDWSKAPEGTTHSTKVDRGNLWYKNDNGTWYYHVGPVTGCGWIPSDNNEEWRAMHLIARPAPVWRGPQDGLPPVGTVCESATRSDKKSWMKGVILAHARGKWESTAIIQHDDGWDYGGVHEFRPTRPERDTAIDEIVAVWKPTMGRFAEEKRLLAGMLYDAGYRKGELK